MVKFREDWDYINEPTYYAMRYALIAGYNAYGNSFSNPYYNLDDLFNDYQAGLIRWNEGF